MIDDGARFEAGRSRPTETIWTGIGRSMLPSILPGSRLHLTPRDSAGVGIEVGDIVCFLDGSRRFVSHRVVAITGETGLRKLMVAGDSSGHPEELDEAAVVGVVTRVDQLFLSYETRGAFGRTLARWAVRRPATFQGAAFATDLLIRLYAVTARFVRRTRRSTL